VKVLVRRSLYARSLTGLLKFGPGARVSSIPMFLAPCQPGTSFSEKVKFDLQIFFSKRGEKKQRDMVIEDRATQKI
jgi:hypothetical protein